MRILVLVLLLWTTSAQAGTNSLLEGTDVWNNCADPRTDQAAMWCQGFTAGVVDGLSFPNPEAIWNCIPAGVTASQLQEILVDFLEDNPTDRHLPVAALAVLAFTEAWPCPAEGH